MEAEITERCKEYLVDPQVSLTITTYRSQPISVLGSVKMPGVLQLEGRKTLFEVISMAGGLAPDAGYTVKITRRKEWGYYPAGDGGGGPHWPVQHCGTARPVDHGSAQS